MAPGEPEEDAGTPFGWPPGHGPADGADVPPGGRRGAVRPPDIEADGPVDPSVAAAGAAAAAEEPAAGAVRHALLVSRWSPFTVEHKEVLDRLLLDDRKPVILIVVNTPGRHPVEVRCEMIQACYRSEVEGGRLRLVVVPDIDEIGVLESEKAADAAIPAEALEVADRWEAEEENRRISAWMDESERRGESSGASSADSGIGTG